MVPDCVERGKKMVNRNEVGSSVAKFYDGREVFITGGTGFVGKVLVEKLLRSCPGIKTVFVLMRPKRGNDVKTRLTELLNCPVFDLLRKSHPEYLNKIIPISGDISQPELGISACDRKILCENVSVVFHSAATVKFDEPLKLAVTLNILGTKRLVELCHGMEKLESLVHVSTAYCNCDLKEVNESLYPPPEDPVKIIKYAEWIDEDLLDSITPRIIKGRPNTYTYTKALAEHVFVEEAKGLPAAIVRPSIVTASWQEPSPGWVDNLNGPTGIIAGAGKGILRTLLCHKNMKADLIPVDFAVNLLITVGWHTAVSRPMSIPIYNCTSGELNPIRWYQLHDYGHQSVTKRPFNDVVWYPGGSFRTSRMANYVCGVLFHTIPAYLLDGVARATGKKPIMVRIQKKFDKAVHALEFFTTHEWKFGSKNTTRLFEKMSEQDKKTFNFDVKSVNWRKYVDHYVEGIKIHVLKEGADTYPSAKSHMTRMYALHLATRMLTMFLLFKFIFMRTDHVRRISYFLWSMLIRTLRFLPIGAAT